MKGQKRTTFSGGGLVVEDMAKMPKLGMPDNFTVPPYIDSRSWCLPANNQGQESSCAGFTTAGYIEVANWRNTHIQKQIDGSAIYAKAKEIDGEKNVPGTTLSHAVEAARLSGLIDKELNIRQITTKQEVQFALHRHGVCISGFMITQDWNNADERNGYIDRRDKTALGGHAVLLCWYGKNGIGWQNSWGDWGDRGFGRCRWDQFEEQFLYAVVLE